MTERVVVVCPCESETGRRAIIALHITDRCERHLPMNVTVVAGAVTVTSASIEDIRAVLRTAGVRAIDVEAVLEETPGTREFENAQVLAKRRDG